MMKPELFEKTLKQKQLRELLRRVHAFLKEENRPLFDKFCGAYTRLSLSGFLEKLEVFIPTHFHKRHGRLFVGCPYEQIALLISRGFGREIKILLFSIFVYIFQPKGFSISSRDIRGTSFIAAPSVTGSTLEFCGLRYVGPLVNKKLLKALGMCYRLTVFKPELQEPQIALEPLEEGILAWKQRPPFRVYLNPNHLVNDLTKLSNDVQCPICGNKIRLSFSYRKLNYTCKSSTCKVRFHRVYKQILKALNARDSNIGYKQFREIYFATREQSENHLNKIVNKNTPTAPVWRPYNEEALIRALWNKFLSKSTLLGCLADHIAIKEHH